MPVGDNLVAEYRNVDTNAKTITVVMPVALTLETGADYPDKVYTLAAGGGAGNIVPSEIRIPLIKVFQDGVTGVATVTVTGTGGVTGVTMAVVER